MFELDNAAAQRTSAGTADPVVRAAWALGAPAAKHPAALTDDGRRVELFLAIVDGFAAHDVPLTRSDVFEALSDQTLTREEFDDVFDTLKSHGTIHPRRTKKSQPLYELDFRALLTHQLLLDLTQEGGYARLHEILVVAADRLTSEDLTADDARDICRSLRVTVRAFTGTVQRVLDQGTTAEIIAERPGRYADQAVDKVKTVVEVTEQRFPALRQDALRLWDAVAEFSATVERLILRVIEELPNLESGGLLAMLSADAYVDAARRASPEDLSGLANRVVFDQPVLEVDLASLESAADAIGRPAPQRQPPRPPTETSGGDVVATLEARLDAEEAERARLRRWADDLLGDGDAQELDSQHERWPGVAVAFGDALEVSRQPDAPYVVEAAEVHVVEPDASTAARFPFRLRRLAQPATADLSRSEDLADE